MEQFRWGLIGPGRIAENFAQALTAIDNANLYAVASRNEQRAASFATKYNVETTYQQYAELVNELYSDPIEEVLIGSFLDSNDELLSSLPLLHKRKLPRKPRNDEVTTDIRSFFAAGSLVVKEKGKKKIIVID